MARQLLNMSETTPVEEVQTKRNPYLAALGGAVKGAGMGVLTLDPAIGIGSAILQAVNDYQATNRYNENLATNQKINQNYANLPELAPVRTLFSGASSEAERSNIVQKLAPEIIKTKGNNEFVDGVNANSAPYLTESFSRWAPASEVSKYANDQMTASNGMLKTGTQEEYGKGRNLLAPLPQNVAPLPLKKAGNMYVGVPVQDNVQPQGFNSSFEYGGKQFIQPVNNRQTLSGQTEQTEIPQGSLAPSVLASRNTFSDAYKQGISDNPNMNPTARKTIADAIGQENINPYVAPKMKAETNLTNVKASQEPIRTRIQQQNADTSASNAATNALYKDKDFQLRLNSFNNERDKEEFKIQANKDLSTYFKIKTGQIKIVNKKTGKTLTANEARAAYMSNYGDPDKALQKDK